MPHSTSQPNWIIELCGKVWISTNNFCIVIRSYAYIAITNDDITNEVSTHSETKPEAVILSNIGRVIEQWEPRDIRWKNTIVGHQWF